MSNQDISRAGASPERGLPASERMRCLLRRNREGEKVGTYAVCSALPAVLNAALRQSILDGSVLHIETTSNQVNQFGGYTGTTPAEFARFIRETALDAGLPSDKVLLGADHLGPYCWRSQPAAMAMQKACELAAQSVLAGYEKIHLDASTPCIDDPKALSTEEIARRTAVLCKAAENSLEQLSSGAPRPLYVVGTEVPTPGGMVVEGEGPVPSKEEEVKETLDAMHKAFDSEGLQNAWKNVIGIVVQPGVEFGDSAVFEYQKDAGNKLANALPPGHDLVYEAHSTDYQTQDRLAELIADHFAILKVGPWLTYAYREAIFALEAIAVELPRKHGEMSRVRQTLEDEMLRASSHWKPYYTGDESQQRYARSFSQSDRCRYYWQSEPVQRAVARLMSQFQEPIPLPLLSQYLPLEHQAIQEGRLENDSGEIVQHHIQRVLKKYAVACGLRNPLDESL